MLISSCDNCARARANPGVELNSFLEELLGFSHVLLHRPVMRDSVRFDVKGRLGRFAWDCAGGAPFAKRKISLQGRSDVRRKITLDRKHICDLAVVILRPNLCAGGGINQLHIEARTISGTSHAAFEDRIHV